MIGGIEPTVVKEHDIKTSVDATTIIILDDVIAF